VEIGEAQLPLLVEPVEDPLVVIADDERLLPEPEPEREPAPIAAE
jgi:hypothetical protein